MPPTSDLPRRRFLQHTIAATTTSLWLPPWFVSTRHAVGAEDAGESFPDKELLVRQKSPYNAEPALDDLIENWITPTKHFYVRNHAPVPAIDADAFMLKVEGLIHKPLQLSLEQLKKRFKAVTVVATMTCAGNRRYEHSNVKQVKGVQWQEGAIGNARWGGVRLSEVLKAAGLKPEAKHVWFEGLDEIDRGQTTIPFGGSIPIEKALHDTQAMPGAIVCHQMNGKPLPPEHGYPLRTVVPGYIGARSVKWLGRIVVSNRPSPNHYLQGAYKIVTKGTDLEWAEAGPIYRWPLNSVIATPQPGTRVKPGKIRVAGYALAPGRPGSSISRVQVSADRGRTILEANITSPVRDYCWVLWTADVPVTPQTKQLLVRAIDSSGNAQPPRVPWNKKGYLYNAWHRVPLTVQS